MKKIIITMTIIFLSWIGIYYWIANQQVLITAIVWWWNNIPVIMSINPSDDPRLLRANKVQKYIVYVKDEEKDDIHYEITPSRWYVNPVNWLITSSSLDNSSWAYINFTYISPSTAWMDTITITTHNSWSTSQIKNLNIYVY